MATESKLALKLLFTLLLLHHGLEKTNAITQFKPQQATVQPKAPQIQQTMQPQQQMQQQPAMQQNTQMQQQSQQSNMQTTSTVQEKDITHETVIKDTLQDPELINPFKMIHEIKRENLLQPSFLPSNHPFPPQIPSMPSLHTVSSPSTWNQNPFMNQGFNIPPAYSGQSYPMPTFSMPSLAGNPYTAGPSLAGNPYTAGNPYQTAPFFGTQKFLPLMGYTQPVFIPFPPFMPSDFFYTPFPGGVNDFEETTSRAANDRRPPLTNGRDSPIYYMRIPPTPYMFLPNFGYSTSQNVPSLNYGANFPPILPFQNIPSYPGLGQTYNLPLNFLANGKPTGIHSFISDIQNSSPFPNFNGFNPRPLAPHLSGNYFQPPYNSLPPPPPYQDSKLTSLKQPFFFNGRPEDIYVLQNSLNPLFSGL